MRLIREKLAAMSLLGILLLLTGCLVSGTFVVTIFINGEDFSTFTGLYHYVVDLSTDSDWEDHKDKIKDIDVIGVELWITNNASAATTFNVWIDDISEPEWMSLGEVDANATKILEDVVIAVGANHITYAESLGLIQNVTTLKTLAESGQFHFYGHSSLLAEYTLDSARVVVTVSAGI